MNIKRITVVTTMALALAGGASPAIASDAEINALREQLTALGARLDQLEASNRELRQTNAQLRASGEKTAAAVADVSEKTTAVAAQVKESSGASSWTDNIKLKGDFRMRHESIAEEGKSTRKRDRVRARAAIVAQVNSDLEVGIGMASGGDDPVSTNQTLGGGGSTKGLNLDLAYFNWSGLENTSIVGGKFKNFLYKPGKNSLLWDGDWNPEGLGLVWADGDYFASAMGTWLESDNKKETEFSYGLQFGFNKELSEGVKLTAGIGYYNLSTRGNGSFYGDDDDFFGNSFDSATNTYLFDYEELELFADLGFSIGEKPAALFLDFVQNQDASAFDTGYAVGFKYGSSSSAGGSQFSVTYQDLERDAVFGLLTDSDFAGGGTDGTGYILKGAYGIAKNWTAGITYFITERDANKGSPRDYDRLQVDMAMKF